MSTKITSALRRAATAHAEQFNSRFLGELSDIDAEDDIRWKGARRIQDGDRIIKELIAFPDTGKISEWEALCKRARKLMNT